MCGGRDSRTSLPVSITPLVTDYRSHTKFKFGRPHQLTLTKPATPRSKGGAVVLRSLLSDDEFTRIAGANLKRYYEILFSYPNGVNLGNNLAHGLMEIREMNRSAVELVLYSLITLTRFQVENSEETGKSHESVSNLK
jgi:hypothetical protein